MTMKQTAIRLDPDLLDRLDKAAEMLAKQSPPGITVNRTAAMRAALTLGLAELERGCLTPRDPAELAKAALATVAVQKKREQETELLDHILAAVKNRPELTLTELRAQFPAAERGAVDAALRALEDARGISMRVEPKPKPKQRKDGIEDKRGLLFYVKASG